MSILDADLHHHRLGRWVFHRSEAILASAERLLAASPAYAIAAMAVIALQLAMIFTHIGWLDEWQALRIAVQSPGLADLFANLHYEAHPPLWYLLLRLLNSITGNPMIVLPLAAALLAVITQSAILFASPFSRLERLMIALSEFILLEFNTISRGYTLGAACLVLAIACWRRRRMPWLFIALLPLCDFLFGVVSIGLMGLRWHEKRLWPPGAALWLICGTLAAWSVTPAADMIPATSLLGPVDQTAIWIKYAGSLGLPLQWYRGQPSWSSGVSPLLLPFSAVGFGLLCFDELRRRPGEAAVLIGLMAVSLLLNISAYTLSFRHVVIFALVLIMLAWRRLLVGGAPTTPLFRLWLAIAAACGVFVAVVSFAMPFNAARQTATEIERQGLAHKNWVSYSENQAEAVAALSDMRFHNLEQNCTMDFMRWNHASAIRKRRQLLGALNAKADVIGQFYLLTDEDIRGAPQILLPIAVIPRGYDGQIYRLFRVRPDLAERHNSAPPCVGPVKPLIPSASH